jgi:hypothetical protein
MYRIIGPTMPVFSLPSALRPKPPSPGTGNHPSLDEERGDQAPGDEGAMFGMIMPDRNVPNF